MAKIIRKKSVTVIVALAMVFCLLPILTMPAGAVTYDGTSFSGSGTSELKDNYFVVTGRDENGSTILLSDKYGIALAAADGSYSQVESGDINFASADSGAVFTMSSITVSVCRKYTFQIRYGSSDTIVASVEVNPADESTFDTQTDDGWSYKKIELEPRMTDVVHVSIKSLDIKETELMVGVHTSIVGFIAEGYPGTPATVTTGSVTDAASTSATMGGSVTDAGSAVVTDRGVVYSTTDATPTIGKSGVTKDANGTGAGSFSKSITGLTPSETYYVCAYATSSVGTSYGSVVNFTTGAVNTAPTFVDSGDGSLTVAMNAGATDITSLLHVSDTDSSQPLTWSQSSAPSHGTLIVDSATASSGNSDITPGGTITYTPNAGYSGDDSFTVQVSDGISAATRTINVTADGTAPTVSSVSVPSDGTYKIGDMLSFTVNFNEAVTVDAGTPYLLITFNTGTVHASYVSGSSTSALVFSYTVAAGDFDADGISAGSFITANGGTLKDAVGNDANLQLNGVTSTMGVKIDGIAPMVSSVSVPSNGTYKADATLSFTVNFSEAVTVTGSPYIPVTLDTGGTVNASYVSGTGTPALVFSYTVASGNLDTDGIAVGSSITANGGTIRDAAGNDASLALSNIGSTASVLVDTVAPTVSSVSVAPDNSYIDVTFSEGIYGANDGIAALSVEDLALTFAQNSGAATDAVISSIKKDDNTAEASAAELAGGETTVRVFLTVSGTPSGTEEIEIKPAGGTSIYDKAGNPMNETQTTGVKSLTDKAAPTVSSVSVPSNGTYKANQTLSFTVNFSEAVTVTGSPYIPVTLDTGGTVNAAYASGSSTTALVFSYTIAAGNLDADGIAVGSSITANGGTIRDAAGNDAALTLSSVSNTKSVLIDAVVPTVNSVSVPSNGTYKADATLSFTVNLSEAVTVTGSPYIPVTLDTGGTVNASYVSGTGTSALVFSYTVASGNLDADGIVVGSSIMANGGTLRDVAGNDAALTLKSVSSTASVLVDAVAPVVSSIERSVPALAATNASSVTFRVTFSKAVSGVDTTDFLLYTTGTVTGTRASVSASSGTTIDVTVNSISGVGMIRLDLKISGTGIIDGAENAISGGYASGQAYTIDTAAPAASVTTQTVAAAASITVQSTETGMVYLISDTLDSAEYDTVSKLDALVSGGSAAKVEISTANTDTTVTAPSSSGIYAAVAVDSVGNISPKTESLVTVDAAAPAASVTTQTVAAAASITVQSTETGTVYLISDTLDLTEYNTVSKLEALVSGGSAAKVEISTANTDTTITAPSSSGAYAAAAVDAVGNISLKTENLVTVDATAPAIIDVVRTDNTHITVTLSEACQYLAKANSGGFSVKETNGESLYTVTETAQGTDSSYVVLTVADMGTAGASGVKVTYTADTNGTIADMVGNALETDATGKTIAAWDLIAPTISSATRNSDTKITVTLSEACQKLAKANNGGFTVTKIGTVTTYAVSQTAQGADSSHVVLTVANMSSASSAGVTVTYTAGGNGTIADTAGNALETNSVGKAITAWEISGGETSSSGSSSNKDASVIVNGETKTAGTAQTATNSSGQTVTTVTVDSNKLEKILAAENSGMTVTIPITGNSDVAMSTLTGSMVKSMETKDATLVVQTNAGTYTLPASEININAVSQQLGTSVALSDIKVTVSISEPSVSMTKVVESAARDGGFTIMVPAVDYTITCTHGSQTVDVSSFNAYVERTIAIPDGVDPSKITTGIVVDTDGTTHHVPTRVTVINGRYYAVINSLTNSTYSVVWNPIEFSDVANHWAKDAINNMGSRMVVTGVGNNNYAPDRNMTRAEFAAIMVRALGLEPETGVSAFSDVAAADWFSGYIKTAAAYGIIKGYDNGNFGPNDTITREQAMTMIARAMEITKLSAGLTGDEASYLLSTFSDGESASAYAKESIAACLKTGITSGTSETEITPQANITRAEVAVMVERLLQKSNLI